MVNHKNPDDLIIQIHPDPEKLQARQSALGLGRRAGGEGWLLGSWEMRVPWPLPCPASGGSLCRPFPSLPTFQGRSLANYSGCWPSWGSPFPASHCPVPRLLWCFSASLCAGLLACPLCVSVPLILFLLICPKSSALVEMRISANSCLVFQQVFKNSVSFHIIIQV